MTDEKKFNTIMNSLDDEMLEEAMTPKRSRPSLLRFAAPVAACLCIVAGCLIWKNTGLSGTKPDLHPAEPGTVSAETPEAVTETPAEPVQDVTLSLPEDAEDVSPAATDDAREDDATTFFTLNGVDYAYSSLPMEEASVDEDALFLSSGSVSVYLVQREDDVTVVWNSEGSDTCWQLSANATSGEVLTAARDILLQTGLDIAVAPEGAEEITCNVFLLDELTVAETQFTLDGIRHTFRMAHTNEIAETFRDISGLELPGAETDCSVRWCSARAVCADGQGKIVWFDVVPGLLYSLSMDSGASEDVLQELALELFDPAQEPDV